MFSTTYIVKVMDSWYVFALSSQILTKLHFHNSLWQRLKCSTTSMRLICVGLTQKRLRQAVQYLFVSPYLHMSNGNGAIFFSEDIFLEESRLEQGFSVVPILNRL
ncbi:hypothetical protein Tcan_05441 [Toxocara canis]|uniref:Uncharacterized protein n=1 Tax=Toxocara canis TaxID=6265 RepID=A0A0B2VNF5_TOXCA|nr:hypothetical protein Tcan_05441 [Toxocara canis]